MTRAMAVLLAGCGLMQGQAVVATGQIHGTVKDGQKGVPHALVTFAREYPRAGEPTAALSIAEADDQGNFAFTGLMAGAYLLCASASPDLQLVPSCEYGAAVSKVLQAAENAAGVDIAMDKGARIEFRVDDPFKLLPANRAAQGNGSGKEVVVGVQSADGLMHHAVWDSRDGLGREYSMIVPHGKPMNIVMQGLQVNVADDKGTPAAQSANGKSPVVAAPNDATRRYRYAVSHDGKN